MIVFERFEGEHAVLEQTDLDGQVHMRVIQRTLLPTDIAEGSVLVETLLGYRVDEEETQLRRRRAITKLHWLKKHED